MAGYVCITFDDCLATQYTNGYPLLAAADIPATAFVPSDLVGSEASYMTSVQLLALEADGWEIGSHGKTHTNLTTMSVGDATTEMTASKTALEALGLTISTFSYPNGAYNADLLDAADDIYSRQRGITGTSAPQYLRHFTTNVRLVNGTSPQTLVLLQGYIDEGIRTDSAVVLYFHSVEADGTLTGTPYKLQDVIAYIVAKQASSGLQAVTYAGLSAVGVTDAIEWGSATAESASTNAAWVGGAKPTTGQHLIFTHAYNGACTLDEAVVYGDVQITEYTGTITQGDVEIGYRDLHVESAATWTGKYDKPQTTAGNTYITAGTYTAEGTYLKVAGTCSFYAPALVWFRSLAVDSGKSLTLNSPTRTSTIFNNAGTITISSGQYLGYWNSRSGNSFANTGSINGPGAFQIDMELKNLSLTLGAINAPLAVRAPTSANGNRTLTVVDAALSLGSTLDVYSSHSTYTTSFFTSGTRTLTVAGLTTFGARGIPIQGTGQWNLNGGCVQSGADSVFTQSGNIVTVGDFTASSGTLTGAGSASVTLTSSGDVNLTGATVTADKLNLVMTGAGKTLTTTATLFGLKASAYTNVAASCGITAGAGSHLTTDAGAFLNIANTKTLTIPLYAAGATLVNNSVIGGLGTLAITMSDGDVSTRLGNILCPLTIASINTAAANRVLTVLDDPSLAAVTVSSSDDDKTTTLDFAGRSAKLNGAVTIGTRGNILWGEGVHHLAGNLDTSAGAVNFETSQIVMTNGGTIKTAASQPFYDLITYAKAVTLASNIDVSNIFAHVGPIIPGAFAVTMTDPQLEYTGMRRPIRRALSSAILMPPCCRPLLDGIERGV